MWACPTGAFSTSPYHCEYWPHPPPPIQAKLTCYSLCSQQWAISLWDHPLLSLRSLLAPSNTPRSLPLLLKPSAERDAAPAHQAARRSQGTGQSSYNCLVGAGWGGGAGRRVKDQAVEHCHQPSWSPVSALMSRFREGSPLRSLSRFL